MKLFEYQAKEAFREKGLPTPKGVLVRGMDELDGAFAEVGFPCVLKSQVLSGGRGKAGLIKVVKDAESAKATAKTLFESEHNVRMLLVEEAVDIDREIYLSITVDPVESKIMLIGCAEGGVEIEKLAATDPDKIVTVRVDIAEGLMDQVEVEMVDPEIGQGGLQGAPGGVRGHVVAEDLAGQEEFVAGNSGRRQRASDVGLVVVERSHVEMPAPDLEGAGGRLEGHLPLQCPGAETDLGDVLTIG